MSIDFKILAYEETELGPLCLRRRRTLHEPRTWVTEVTLNHEFLMSSFHTDSERALATLAIERVAGEELKVLVGGLGLGYTAAAALDSAQVSRVEVYELLPPVIQWMESGMVPLSKRLNAEERLKVVRADVYKHLLKDPVESQWDAILIDVDHSPEDQLAQDDHGFYSHDGLAKAARHLNPGGVLALWSYEGNDLLEREMRLAYDRVEVLPVPYFNQHVSKSFTDWLFIGKRA